jgi:hypothetical protein
MHVAFENQYYVFEFDKKSFYIYLSDAEAESDDSLSFFCGMEHTC